MIDLTPLDVRKKRGDFRRAMRGYDADSVDQFLEQVAERLDEVVRENHSLRERAAQLAQAVEGFRERERAMNDALISAQQLREETRAQAERDAELTVREARAEAERILAEARRQLATVEEALRKVQAQRHSYLRGFRSLLERHLEQVGQEEERLRDLVRADIDLPVRPRTAPASPPWLAALDNPSSGASG
jgi:DivIVA domain-containing protein